MNNSGIELLLSSDCDYEELTVEIYYDGKFIALLNQDNDLDTLSIEFPASEVANEIIFFMLRFADLVLSKHEALLRGQVIGPGKSLFSHSEMNAIYISIPVIFEEGFNTFEGSSPPTVLVWLVPIFADEARYVEKYGWGKFEDILEQKNPDLWNIERQSVIA